VVYRLGFARSRVDARQLVRHGHFTVNGRRVNIPSYLVQIDDEIAVAEKSREMPLFAEIAESAAQKTPPHWLEVDAENMKGRVLGLPAREDIDVPIQEHLIVELYSR
jgi:small subunit ribosomal protein S4